MLYFHPQHQSVSLCSRQRLNKKVNFQENYSQKPFWYYKNWFCATFFLDLLPDDLFVYGLEVWRLDNWPDWNMQRGEFIFFHEQFLPQCCWARYLAYTSATAPVEHVNHVKIQWLECPLNHLWNVLFFMAP